jgi:hypothetical protein
MKWQQYEINYLKSCYGKYKLKDLIKTKFKNRTISSLMCYARKLGLKSNRSYLISGNKNPFYKKHHSIEFKNYLSKKQKIRFKNKKNHPFTNKHHKLKTRRLLSKLIKTWYSEKSNQEFIRKINKKKSDYWISNPEKNNFYVHGNGNYPYPKDWTKRFRKEIIKRDKKCAICNISNQYSKRYFKLSLYVHHIDRNKNNLNNLNLISLCYICHGRIIKIQDELHDYFHAKLLGLIS